MLTLSILNSLQKVDVQKSNTFISSCQNFDGGYGCVPGAESHAGQIFCCIASLSIGHGLDAVDRDTLGWWLSERQCDSGGLNGRPEKQAGTNFSSFVLCFVKIISFLFYTVNDQRHALRSLIHYFHFLTISVRYILFP